MRKSEVFFRKLLKNIQKELKLEKTKHFTLEAYLTIVNDTMDDKYTKNELRNIKTYLGNNIKELTDHREEYFPVGVVILAEYEEYPETCMFIS